MLQHWQTVLKQRWGIQANLIQLGGEYDLNLLAKENTGEKSLLKVMRAGCERDLIEMQIAAVRHIQRHNKNLPIPGILPSTDGNLIEICADASGTPRLCWLIEGIEGTDYANFTPKTASLIRELGGHGGALNHALADFEHPALDRELKWNLTSAGWIEEYLDISFSGTRREILRAIITSYAEISNALGTLSHQAIHNDINDYNIIVNASSSTKPFVTGLIDFGDMCRAPRICDLAIAGAYIVLDHPHPERALTELVRGHHAINPVTEQEISLLWPLLRMRLAVSVVNSTLMAQGNPDDPYVTISQAPAWRFLEGCKLTAEVVEMRLRVACGYPLTSNSDDVLQWLDAHRNTFHPVLGKYLGDAPCKNLSPEHSTHPENPFELTTAEAHSLSPPGTELPWLGYWREPRLVYTSAEFRSGPWKASDRRTVHLGVDIFDAEKSIIYSPLDAIVYAVENRPDQRDYGGVVILEHRLDDANSFFTLYGHLDPEVTERLNSGDRIRKGEAFARLGDATENGGWSPHLHFQLALSVAGMESNWPGVADPDDIEFWQALCPNPAALLNIDDIKVAFKPFDKSTLLEKRNSNFTRNLSLSYDEPVLLLRGWRHHLFDEWGRPYLDAYNNVPHVGHAHPRIRDTATDQLARMNSNTRYLHPAPQVFAEKLLSKLPDQFQVCFFVNSGSEANELALRLARAATGAKGMVTPDHGYHGNTTGAMDISAYKFNASEGTGKPDWVELVEVADDYLGSYDRQDPDRAEKYANQVATAISRLTARGHGLAGFIAETFPSVGGQIIPPKGYLKRVYEHIRAAGGVCIADEVQTGLGRLGDYYFGFEHQDATPDIVVLGKPIGNGHPIGAVITTRHIADKFAEGPEFFSTFGGSNLSARIGAEVLQIVDDEGLQENARAMGNRLLRGLKGLQSRHPTIGDVRGIGLFVGVDLVENPETKHPGTGIARYVKNRLRENRILVGTEGPHDNILKIRPPLTIEADDIDMILTVLDEILSETPIRLNI